MRELTVAICFALTILGGCSSNQTGVPAVTPKENGIIAWPKDWSERLGQVVTVEGNAADSKIGAYLQGNGKDLWIEGLDNWPKGYYMGGDNTGKRIRATGVVIKRDDLPVFVQQPGVFLQGIPVQSKEELEKAKWRFLLKDTKWKAVE